jgi:hypothetical protein
MELEKLKADLQKMPHDRDIRVNYVKGWLTEHGNGDDPALAYELIDQKYNIPEICVTGRHLQDKTADALAAIIQSNNPPRMFRHGGGLARTETTEIGQPIITQLNESATRGEMTRSAIWHTLTEKGGNTPAHPPLDVVRDFLTMPGGWPGIPIILGIVENPVIRPDGSILEKHGYDPATKLYYYPAEDINIPPIPDNPSANDITKARDLLFEIFCDFPFDGDASRANVIAALITPVVRPLIFGPTPLCCIDKPQIGSGASLIASCIAEITTGRTAAIMTAPTDPDEWRKMIMGVLTQGRTIVVLDNIEGRLYDANLAAVLTATTYAVRILGTNEIRDVPNLASWIATGNYISLGGDLPRRAYLVTINPEMARPWLRDVSQFKHPELEKWVKDNRGEILAAILTLARAWIITGKPLPTDIPRLGGYGKMYYSWRLANHLVVIDPKENKGWDREIRKYWQSIFKEEKLESGEVLVRHHDVPWLRQIPPEVQQKARECFEKYDVVDVWWGIVGENAKGIDIIDKLFPELEKITKKV